LARRVDVDLGCLVDVGVEQHHGDGGQVPGANARRDRVQFCIVRRRDRNTVRADTRRALQHAVTRHDAAFLAQREIERRRHTRAADLEHVAIAARGDKRNRSALVLQNGV
jgi:hypothetical protein